MEREQPSRADSFQTEAAAAACALNADILGSYRYEQKKMWSEIDHALFSANGVVTQAEYRTDSEGFCFAGTRPTG